MLLSALVFQRFHRKKKTQNICAGRRIPAPFPVGLEEREKESLLKTKKKEKQEMNNLMILSFSVVVMQEQGVPSVPLSAPPAHPSSAGSRGGLGPSTQVTCLPFLGQAVFWHST